MSYPVLYIAGVSGSGKTTIGKLVADAAGFAFFDADDFHPETNKEKMRNGVPLTDEDRIPWLAALHQLAADQSAKKGVVIACSALKSNYRQVLTDCLEKYCWIWLYGSAELLQLRMEARSAHFMPASLLVSQMSIAEPPLDAVHINVDQSVQEIQKIIVRYIAGFGFSKIITSSE